MGEKWIYDVGDKVGIIDINNNEYISKILRIGEDGEINIELFNSYSCQYINVDVAGRAGELMFSNHAITETRINSKAEEYAEAIEKEVKKEEKDDVKK